MTAVQDVLATKEDLLKLELATREDIMKLQIDIEKRFNQLTIWIVGALVAFAGIVIAVMKL